MEQRIKVTISDQQIKGTILDTLRINARVLAALGSSGSGMNGAFTEVTLSGLVTEMTLNVSESDSEKVYFTLTAGQDYSNTSLDYLGIGTAGEYRLIWLKIIDGTSIAVNCRALGSDGIFVLGVNNLSAVNYAYADFEDVWFDAVCLGGNQWVMAAKGGADATTFGWFSKVDGQTHDQNTDQYLDFGGPYQVSAGDIAGGLAQMSEVVDFTAYNDNPDAYTIPVVQDVAGVKSLKYSAEFTFENGCLKVKGAGNTTGKTLSLFNLDGDENVTVLDNGNVGIGKTNPGYTLEIIGTLKTSSYIFTDNVIYTGNTNTSFSINSLQSYKDGVYQIKNINTGNNSALSFLTKNIEALRIDPSQNVGIKTTTPAKSLEVSHATGDCFRLSYDKSTIYKADFTLDSAGKLTIAAAGNVEFTGDVNLTGVLKIDGVQVVKEQQANILDLKSDYDTGELDSEAEIITAINDIAKKIKEVTDAMKAHGLIASA